VLCQIRQRLGCANFRSVTGRGSGPLQTFRLPQASGEPCPSTAHFLHKNGDPPQLPSSRTRVLHTFRPPQEQLPSLLASTTKVVLHSYWPPIHRNCGPLQYQATIEALYCNDSLPQLQAHFGSSGSPQLQASTGIVAFHKSKSGMEQRCSTEPSSQSSSGPHKKAPGLHWYSGPPQVAGHVITPAH
jgi:hypothetical protein